MERRKLVWTDHQKKKLNYILEILDELQDYLPLTLRQIFYQLVSKEYIKNTKSHFVMLTSLIKYGRIDGFIPWNSIEDRIRVFHDLSGWSNANKFVDASLDYFLEGYQRNLLQSQNKYIEIWIEKDALASIFQKIAIPYTIPVVVCRGFSSVSFLYNFTNRINAHSEKYPIMLYFGDFDPSGEEMLIAMEKTLEEMGCYGVEFQKIALTPEQIKKHKLPHNPDALKRSDSRALKHINKYGYLAVELDALRPDTLTNIVTNAIESEIDIDLFNEEKRIEIIEFDKINKTKEKIQTLMEE